MRSYLRGVIKAFHIDTRKEKIAVIAHDATYVNEYMKKNLNSLTGMGYKTKKTVQKNGKISARSKGTRCIFVFPVTLLDGSAPSFIGAAMTHTIG